MEVCENPEFLEVLLEVGGEYVLMRSIKYIVLTVLDILEGFLDL